ncbi:MAG: radical SAM protein [Candidatus Woesearchaeota archaeon]
MVTENRYHSYHRKELPLGCRYCVKGEKLVLFVTGICPRHCYFCPVSDHKSQKDLIFANEREVTSSQDIIKEAELMRAKGAGITGGDPLTKIDRVVEYIQLLKQHFGKEFHIHLYTSLNLVTEEILKQLFEAGLDEIRFHLDLESKLLWNKLSLAREFSWKVGVEIPLIPTKEKETFEVLEFVKDKIDFLNLNELEIADNAQSKLSDMGFCVKDEQSYAIAGSLELGLKILEYADKKELELPIHTCTAKLKDSVQLANRLKREAEGAKLPFDLVDEEGMLTRGALYLPELVPGFEYRQKLKSMDMSKFVAVLKPLLERVKKELRLTELDLYLDEKKPRILLSKSKIKQNRALFKRLKLIPAIVTEYPTADQLEVEVELFE